MSQICLYIPLEDYLADWFVHDQGGNNPVHLMRGSIESGLLEQFLQTPPEGYVPDMGGEGKLAIVIPNFRYKSPEYYFYLPPKATDAFIACLRQRFDIIMWQSLHRFSSVFQRQDHLIYAFMEKYGIAITEKNWNAIAKRYQRKRDYYLMNERRKKMKKNRTDFGK